MDSNTTSRSSTFQKLIWQPWKKRTAILIGIIGIYDLFLAQFLPDQLRHLFPTIINVFPRLNWAWWTWVIIVLITIIVFMFQGAHNEISLLLDEISPPKIAANIELKPIEYDQPQDNRHLAAVRITNRNNRRIAVYGKMIAILRNDDGFSENLIEQINFYQSKLTWRGGDSSKGWKTIDPNDHRDLNIAFVETHKLRFIFRKESPYVAPPGIYRVKLMVMGQMDDREIKEIEFLGHLEYWGKVRLSFRDVEEGETQLEVT
jgi:hypothetical protein